jgi:LacI family transcriptional regulator
VSASLKDVARLTGVSITTVSHALNHTRFVQPETAERVFAAVRQLEYSPNCIARGLRTGASRTIEVIGPSAEDPFFAEVVVGIEEICYARGYEVYLGFVEYPRGVTCDEPMDDLRQEEEFLRSILSGRYNAPTPVKHENMRGMDKEEPIIDKLISREVDGLVINPGQTDSVVVQALAGVKPKLALFHRAIAGVAADVFVSDDSAGVFLALESLLGMGHRRIGMINGFSWENHSVRERFCAYRDAPERGGIGPDVALFANGAYSLDGAAEATLRLLALPDPPTAYVARESVAARD